MLRSVVLVAIQGGASACTVLAAGSKATADGSVLVSHSDDGDPNNDGRLIYVPAADHEAGSARPIFYAYETFPRYVGYERGPDYVPNSHTGSSISKPIGFIPEVAHTFGYQDSTYGVINEHGVAVGESTCGAMFGTCGAGSTQGCEPGRKVGEALMSIDTLSKIAMERCRTSREAVELMGSFASLYGFYGPLDSFEGSGESLVVADPTEAWAFQILSDPSGTSAIWAARRVPDTDVTVVANMFTIREVNASDADNFILSPNIFSVAKQQGWWHEGEPLDFTRMYSGGEYAHKYYSGRRMWRGLSLAAPSSSLRPDYTDIRYKPAFPWSVKPDKLVTHHDFISWHRDWYAGTEFDMTKGIQAGPFGTPDRYSTDSNVSGHWERSIALYRTNVAYVSHLRKSSHGESTPAQVVWFGSGAAHYAPFLPIPARVKKTIMPLAYADPNQFEKNSINWASRKVMDVCQIRWDKMHAMVEKNQQSIETEGERLLVSAQSAFLAGSDAGNFDIIFEKHAKAALAQWHALAMEMLFFYSDNMDTRTGAELSYPDEWLELSGYKNGPPPAPVEDQCPPNCSTVSEGSTPAIVV